MIWADVILSRYLCNLPTFSSAYRRRASVISRLRPVRKICTAEAPREGERREKSEKASTVPTHCPDHWARKPAHLVLALHTFVLTQRRWNGTSIFGAGWKKGS